METLHEAPPPTHWLDVAKAINLTAAQKAEVCGIFKYASQVQASAMERQAGIVQELQAVSELQAPHQGRWLQLCRLLTVTVLLRGSLCRWPLVAQ